MTWSWITNIIHDSLRTLSTLLKLDQHLESPCAELCPVFYFAILWKIYVFTLSSYHFFLSFPYKTDRQDCGTHRTNTETEIEKPKAVTWEGGEPRKNMKNATVRQWKKSRITISSIHKNIYIGTQNKTFTPLRARAREQPTEVQIFVLIVHKLFTRQCTYTK